ncbi:hypothetical protein BG74_00600 [Sodalis-like endosymbiont of Proechinophthirus fluctus]|nr:hypothetical protein BG74_00600 [Sodalis-like endosymbiont of Proechinophthirus fluctus]
MHQPEARAERDADGLWVIITAGQTVNKRRELPFRRDNAQLQSAVINQHTRLKAWLAGGKQPCDSC